MNHCNISNYYFFFFNDTATTEIYTLSLHDALPISRCSTTGCAMRMASGWPCWSTTSARSTSMQADRKSTRLNSSHVRISYAVFCLKKKKFVWRVMVGKNIRNDVLGQSHWEDIVNDE